MINYPDLLATVFMIKEPSFIVCNPIDRIRIEFMKWNEANNSNQLFCERAINICGDWRWWIPDRYMKFLYRFISKLIFGLYITNIMSLFTRLIFCQQRESMQFNIFVTTNEAFRLKYRLHFSSLRIVLHALFSRVYLEHTTFLLLYLFPSSVVRGYMHVSYTVEPTREWPVLEANGPSF